MAELHLDQNVPRTVAQALSQLGHVVHTARSLQMSKSQDAEHLLAAANAGRVLITKDRDYLVLQVAWRVWQAAWQIPIPQQHAGILIISDHWTGLQAAQEIDRVLRAGRPLADTLLRYETLATGSGHWVAG